MLNSKLPDEFAPYSLIYSIRNDRRKIFSFEQRSVSDFVKLRIEGVSRFYLRSHVLTAHIADQETVPYGAQGDYQTYLMYNGLIDLQHGIVRNGKIEQSHLGFIDKYFKADEPEEIYDNKEYLKIYKGFVRALKSVLKAKSKQVWLDGREFISKTNDMSEGFASKIKRKEILASVEIA